MPTHDIATADAGIDRINAVSDGETSVSNIINKLKGDKEGTMNPNLVIKNDAARNYHVLVYCAALYMLMAYAPIIYQVQVPVKMYCRRAVLSRESPIPLQSCN